MLDVRDCLKPAIDLAGMKQFAVAEKAGLTQQQLCDVINKRRKLDANELVGLCKILRISPNELLKLSISKREQKEEV